MRLLCLVSLFCIQTVLASGEVWAESSDSAPTPSLSWVRLPGAEECIGIAELGRSVEAQLGHALFTSPTVAPFSIEGWVAPSSEGEEHFRATIVVRDAEGAFIGERIIESEPAAGCRSMDSTLILALSITVDPDAVLGSTNPVSADGAREGGPTVDPIEEDGVLEELAALEVPPPPLAPAPAPTPAPAPAPEQEPAESELRVDLSASFIVGLELLPGVPLGAAATVVLDFPRFPPLELTLGSFIGATVTREEVEARFNQVYARIALCVPWRLDIVQFHGCAGIEGGVTIVEGHGLDLPGQDVRPVIDFVAGFSVLFRPVSRLLLRIGVTAIVPVFHDSYVYSNEMNQGRELFEVGAFGGVFDVGVGVEL